MVKIFLFQAVLLTCLRMYGQSLEAGDRVADMLFTKVLNYSKPVLKLSDFAGKKIIFDFWHTSCTACFKVFPKIDSLQKVFGEQVQFILINREDLETTKKFFIKRKQIKAPGVPMITGDTTLINLFDITGFPHSVWLDENRIVKHSTGSHNISGANLSKFVSGRQLNVQEGVTRWRHGSAFDIEQGGSKKEDMLLYYSYLSKCVNGLLLGSERPTVVSDSSVRISGRCLSIVELYKQAYGYGDFHRFAFKGSVDLKVARIADYVRPSDELRDAWASQYAYSYDLVLPAHQLKEIYRVMQEDLGRYFRHHVSVERRCIRGLALVSLGDHSALRSVNRGGMYKDEGAGGRLVMKDQPFKVLTERLEGWCRFFLGLPFRDDSGIGFPCIDFNVLAAPFTTDDISRVNQELRRYGLALTETFIEKDVLVIREER